MAKEAQQHKKFGQNVASIRRRQGKTQEQLAEITGLATRSIQNIELGGRFPRLETLLMLSRALKVKPEEFFKDLK